MLLINMVICMLKILMIFIVYRWFKRGREILKGSIYNRSFKYLGEFTLLNKSRIQCFWRAIEKSLKKTNKTAMKMAMKMTMKTAMKMTMKMMMITPNLRPCTISIFWRGWVIMVKLVGLIPFCNTLCRNKHCETL